MLERVSGELADLLTGGNGGERVCRSLERAGAFVVSLDARRGRGSATTACSLSCCGWSCAAPSRANSRRCTRLRPGGSPGTGIPWRRSVTPRRPQDWSLAARLLSDTGSTLHLGGQPPLRASSSSRSRPRRRGQRGAHRADRGGRAGPGIAGGGGERQLARASGALGVGTRRVRRGRLQVMIAVLRLYLARQRGDLPAVSEAGRWLARRRRYAGRTPAQSGEDLRALTLISLGIAESLGVPIQGRKRSTSRKAWLWRAGSAAVSRAHRPCACGGTNRPPVLSRGRSEAAGDRPGQPARLE